MHGTSVSVQVLIDKRWLYCGDGSEQVCRSRVVIDGSLVCVTAKIRMAGELV